ncbi:GNAT family N-acetyltransferase [Streptosporangium sp. NPDC000396]|uniref:GNAT family N-acetyltransferase n=1 Tax=Streptosporangium sp. NPDC000396 TaxID=3366185 RepID=UPI003698B7C5
MISVGTRATILSMISPVPSPSAEIRPVSFTDAPLLARLNDFVHSVHALHRPDVFRSQPAHDDLTPIFEAHLAREDVRAFVAHLSGRPVGYALARIVDRPGDALMRASTFIVLEHLAVAPEATRTGVGSALVDAVRTAGRAAGCSRLVTDVWDFNEEALAFYRAAGFAPMRQWLEQSL